MLHKKVLIFIPNGLTNLHNVTKHKPKFICFIESLDSDFTDPKSNLTSHHLLDIFSVIVLYTCTELLSKVLLLVFFFVTFYCLFRG